MGELDDLAAANQARQRVPVRRSAGQMMPQQPVVLITQPPQNKGNSAFLSGFLGTFGVVCALLVIGVAFAFWRGCENEMERQRKAAEARDVERRIIEARTRTPEKSYTGSIFDERTFDKTQSGWKPPTQVQPKPREQPRPAPIFPASKPIEAAKAYAGIVEDYLAQCASVELKLVERGRVRVSVRASTGLDLQEVELTLFEKEEPIWIMTCPKVPKGEAFLDTVSIPVVEDKLPTAKITAATLVTRVR